MNKGKAFLFLLAVIGLSALWHTALMSYKIYAYSRLNVEAAPLSMSWKVVEHGSSTYTLMAEYEFVAAKTTFHGSTDFQSETYLNAATAEKSIEKIAAHPWKVWFDQEDPRHSSLQKEFPLKQTVYAVILWGIFLYFVWLRLLVGRV